MTNKYFILGSPEPTGIEELRTCFKCGRLKQNPFVQNVAHLKQVLSSSIPVVGSGLPKIKYLFVI